MSSTQWVSFVRRSTTETVCSQRTSLMWCWRFNGFFSTTALIGIMNSDKLNQSCRVDFRKRSYQLVTASLELLLTTSVVSKRNGWLLKDTREMYNLCEKFSLTMSGNHGYIKFLWTKELNTIYICLDRSRNFSANCSINTILASNIVLFHVY